MLDFHRQVVEMRIADDRPATVLAAAWVMVPMGLLAPYFVIWSLAQAWPGGLSVRDVTVILSAGAATLVANCVVCFGLYRGRLLGWFAALSWGILGGTLPAVTLMNQIRQGLAPKAAVGLAPFQSTLVGLCWILLALLWWPGTRRWIFTAHRVRSLSAEEFERHFWDK